MRYNIIGDIHGQTKWKELIIPNTVTVFVGDYFSPYFNISFEVQKSNFLDIIKFKSDHPDEVVLLLGNHDLEYFWTPESYSRHDRAHELEIEKLFKDNLHLFQMAYSIENKVLVTHAGVTKEWWSNIGIVHDKFSDESFNSLELNPYNTANLINDMFNHNEEWAFEFHPNAGRWDYCGETVTQSCVWIRPWVLRQCDLFFDKFKQVFGHTISKSVSGVDRVRGFDESCLIPLTEDNINDFNLYMVDCLSYDTASLVYDSRDDKFSLNKLDQEDDEFIDSTPDEPTSDESDKIKEDLDKLIAAI